MKMKIAGFGIMIALVTFSSVSSFALGQNPASADKYAGTGNTGTQADLCDKKFALALYNPILSAVLAIPTPSRTVFSIPPYTIYLSAEAEYSITQYLSVASELRFCHNPAYHFDDSADEEEGIHRTPSHTYYALGPGLRLYPAGNGMRGGFIAAYYQLLIGTKHGILNPFSSRYVTAWVGYRFIIDSRYMEVASGSAYSNTFENRPRVCPLLTWGFGICF
jgi:hypothetical protein